jgi:hypothetical protein
MMTTIGVKCVFKKCGERVSAVQKENSCFLNPLTFVLQKLTRRAGRRTESGTAAIFLVLFRYELFVRFVTWTFVSNCVSEYVRVFVFVSVFANPRIPRTVLRA